MVQSVDAKLAAYQEALARQEEKLGQLFDTFIPHGKEKITLVLNGEGWKQILTGKWIIISHGGSAFRDLYLHLETPGVSTQVMLKNLRWVGTGMYETVT